MNIFWKVKYLILILIYYWVHFMSVIMKTLIRIRIFSFMYYIFHILKLKKSNIQDYVTTSQILI